MPKKIVKRKPKKVRKRKPKKVSKRKPKKVRKRRKFGASLVSEKSAKKPINKFKKRRQKKEAEKKARQKAEDRPLLLKGDVHLVPPGSPYQKFTRDQTKDKGAINTKFVGITIKQLGFKSNKTGRPTSYEYTIQKLGKVIVVDGEVKELNIDDWFDDIDENNIQKTRIAKYRSVYNIIKLVFLTQLYILEKLGNSKRFTATSNLLDGIKLLNESSKPFKNLNIILEKIARQTGDDEILKVEGEWSDRGVLQSASLVDAQERMFLGPLSLRTAFDPGLTKFDIGNELVNMNPYSRKFYKKAFDTVKKAKPTEWNLAKEFIEDIKAYLYVNKKNLLNTETLKVYEVVTVRVLPGEKTEAITHIMDLGDGKKAVKISAKKDKLFSDSEDSEEEVEEIEETLVVDTLADTLQDLNIKEKESLKSSSKRLNPFDEGYVIDDIGDKEEALIRKLQSLNPFHGDDNDADRKEKYRSDDDPFFQVFGKKRRKKKSSKKKKGPSSSLKKLCKRLKVRLTTKRKGKRVYKSEKVLKSQCKKAAKKSSFGKPKKKVSKKKKGPSSALKKLCKSLKVKLTVKRGKKRVYKSEKVLKGQCRKASKAKLKKRRKSKFGG